MASAKNFSQCHRSLKTFRALCQADFCCRGELFHSVVLWSQLLFFLSAPLFFCPFQRSKLSFSLHVSFSSSPPPLALTLRKLIPDRVKKNSWNANIKGKRKEPFPLPSFSLLESATCQKKERQRKALFVHVRLDILVDG